MLAIWINMNQGPVYMLYLISAVGTLFTDTF